MFAELEEAEESGSWGEMNVPNLGNTTLDRLHQSMILFATGRGEALKRFLIEEGVGRDKRSGVLLRRYQLFILKTQMKNAGLMEFLQERRGLVFRKRLFLLY